MAKLMMDALKIAFAKQGIELPVSNTTARQEQSASMNIKSKLEADNSRPSPNQQLKPRVEIISPGVRNLNPHVKKTAITPKLGNKNKSTQSSTSRQGNKIYGELAGVYGAINKPMAPKPAPLPPWTLNINPDAKTHPFLLKKMNEFEVISSKHSGINEQFSNNIGDENPSDMVIGLDFGTSSVKVVVGDKTQDIAFAIPFSKIEGIDGYLLPSRLWQTEENFSIIGGSTVHRDLKLSLLTNNDQEHIKRATAFLALVIRHVRGWLFSEYAEIYSQSKMVWKLVLGIPAANYETDPKNQVLVDKFRLIAKAAWLAAGKHKKDMNLDLVSQSLARAKELFNGAALVNESEEVEVDVVPELSAQIYGFCVSQSFDKKAENVFMTVDVGAGTIDSSVFQVKKGKGGKWDFEFFTNQVQQNGVMNLHRNRIDWWSEALAGREDPALKLVNELNRNRWHTDFNVTIPDSMDDYLKGLNLKFSDLNNHPDTIFFKKRVAKQVRSDTLFQASKYLDKNMLVGIPMFLCGGGVRMPYYQKLEQELAYFPGVTWLKATKRALVKPTKLRAQGLADADYDRLSVAFGLSFLEVGKIVKALQNHKVPNNEASSHYTDNYVSKDVC